MFKLTEAGSGSEMGFGPPTSVSSMFVSKQPQNPCPGSGWPLTLWQGKGERNTPRVKALCPQGQRAGYSAISNTVYYCFSHDIKMSMVKTNKQKTTETATKTSKMANGSSSLERSFCLKGPQAVTLM